MNQILLTNLFFIITSIGVIALTIMVLVILYFIYKIVRDIQAVSEKIRVGSESLSEDLGEVRSQLKQKGVYSGLVIALMSAVAGFSNMHKQKAKKKKEDAE